MMSSLFEAMLREMLEDRPKMKKELPKETKGFESLVTEEEYNAICELKKALDNYVDVHNKCVFSNKEKITKADTYARTQYLFLGFVCDDAIKAVNMMYSIHTLDKESLDEMLDEETPTIEDLERNMSLNALASMLDI